MKTRVVMYGDGRTTYCRIFYWQPEIDNRDTHGCGLYRPAAWRAWPENQYRQYETIGAARGVAQRVAAGEIIPTEEIVAEYGAD